jgi:hypothetical protein
MLALPKQGHDMEDYAIRRGYDYLVRHLQNAEPPHEFKFNGTFTSVGKRTKEIMELEEKIERILQSENSSARHAVKHEKIEAGALDSE